VNIRAFCQEENLAIGDAEPAKVCATLRCEGALEYLGNAVGRAAEPEPCLGVFRRNPFEGVGDGLFEHFPGAGLSGTEQLLESCLGLFDGFISGE
jgi:hypothetical protein